MHQHPPCLMASVSKSERVRTLSSRTEYGSCFMRRRSYAERRNEASCLPTAHRLDPNVGELKDEEQCRQGGCYNEDERQREIATQEAATFGFEDAEAREDSHAIPRPSRKSNCFRIAFRWSRRHPAWATHGSIVDSFP